MLGQLLNLIGAADPVAVICGIPAAIAVLVCARS